MSHIQDHTALFTAAMLDDVLARLDVTGIRKFVMWADTGKHFRAYEFLGFWTVATAEKFGVDTALKFWPEAHGKCLCDGFFGLLSGATLQAALTTTLSDCADLCKAWEAYFKELQESSDPMNATVTFVHFEPPQKKNVPRKIMNGDAMGLAIASSYMWSSSIRTPGAPIFGNKAQPSWATNLILRNHVLPGRAAEGTTPIVKIGNDATEDLSIGWRRSKRDDQPEKEKPPIRKLQKRFHAQFLNKPLPAAGRHRSYAARLQSSQRSREKRKEREKRNRAFWKKTVVENTLPHRKREWNRAFVEVC